VIARATLTATVPEEEGILCSGVAYSVAVLVRFCAREAVRRKVPPADREDLVQDALLELARRKHAVRNPFPYLNTVIRRLAANERASALKRKGIECGLEVLRERDVLQVATPWVRISIERAIGRLSSVDSSTLDRIVGGDPGACSGTASYAMVGSDRVRLCRIRKLLRRSL
jgi:hypothetical protein